MVLQAATDAEALRALAEDRDGPGSAGPATSRWFRALSAAQDRGDEHRHRRGGAFRGPGVPDGAGGPGGRAVGYIPKTEPSENVAGALGLVLADADGIADEILHGATGHSPLASSVQGRRGITRRVRPDERRSSAELNLAKNIVFQYAI